MFQMSTFLLKSSRFFGLKICSKISINRLLCQAVSVKSNNDLERIYENVTKEAGKINIGIIGGGMATTIACSMLKQYSFIQSIHLIDTKNTLAEAVRDASYIDTKTEIHHYSYQQLEDERLVPVFSKWDIVAIMDESDFNLSYVMPQVQILGSHSYVYNIAKTLAFICPKALIAVFVRPVTANVPLVLETIKSFGCVDPNKIIGSVSLETMRIESATAQFLNLNPACMSVPMIGGADSYSSVPVLSKAKLYLEINHFLHKFSIEHFRNADRDANHSVPGSSVLSTGVAAAKFILTLSAGLNNCNNIVANAYVKTNAMPVCNYFANQVSFGPNGVDKILNLPQISSEESQLLLNSFDIINECESLVTDFVRKQTLNDTGCDLSNNKTNEKLPEKTNYF